MARRFAKDIEEEIVVSNEEAFFYPSELVNTKTTIPPLFLKVVSNQGSLPKLGFKGSPAISNDTLSEHWFGLLPMRKRTTARWYNVLVLFVAQCSLVKSDEAISM